jgi:hypothetical protein
VDDVIGYEQYQKQAGAITNEYKALSSIEKKELLKELLNKQYAERSKAEEKVIRIDVLTHLIATELIEADLIKLHLAAFKRKFGIAFFDIDTIPNSMFSGVKKLDLSVVESFRDVMFAIAENNQPKEAIAQFRKKVGKAPVCDLAELFYCRQYRPYGYVKKVLKCYNNYPDYFLFQVFSFPIITEEKSANDIHELEKFLIQKKNTVTKMEICFFFEIYTSIFLENTSIDLSQIIAYNEYLESFCYIEHPIEMSIKLLINAAKVSKINDLIDLGVK